MEAIKLDFKKIEENNLKVIQGGLPRCPGCKSIEIGETSFQIPGSFEGRPSMTGMSFNHCKECGIMFKKIVEPDEENHISL